MYEKRHTCTKKNECVVSCFYHCWIAQWSYDIRIVGLFICVVVPLLLVHHSLFFCHIFIVGFSINIIVSVSLLNRAVIFIMILLLVCLFVLPCLHHCCIAAILSSYFYCSFIYLYYRGFIIAESRRCLISIWLLVYLFVLPCLPHCCIAPFWYYILIVRLYLFIVSCLHYSCTAPLSCHISFFSSCIHIIVPASLLYRTICSFFLILPSFIRTIMPASLLYRAILL